MDTKPDKTVTSTPVRDKGASEEPKAAFLAAVEASLADGSFLKLTLGKYRGAGLESRTTAQRIELKDGTRLKIVTRRGTQDLTQTVSDAEALRLLTPQLGTDYLSATLFTPTADTTLVYSKKLIPRLTRSKPTLHAAPGARHDRAKRYPIEITAPYLFELGITHGGDGRHERQIKPSMYGKFRQICRFIEILDGLVASSSIKDAAEPRIVDIGSGKGYLTIALHEHLTRQRSKAPVTFGIDANSGLVTECNGIAKRTGMSRLSFRVERAEAFVANASGVGGIDILIALHACDTATDDAIQLGLSSGAALIVVAPCCQQEVAPQIKTGGSPLAGLLRFGLFRQRQADLVTDAMRALALEAAGYEVRVIEFVSTEHTAKNLLLAAVRSSHVDRARARAELAALAMTFGITNQRLHQHLLTNEQPHDASDT